MRTASLSQPMFHPLTVRWLIAVGVLLSPATLGRLRGDDALPVAAVHRDQPVHFQTDVLPLLRRNCIACHNASDAESDLVLETPESILQGGAEGPGVVPGNAEESLVFQLAAHQRESFMPPEGNTVGAGDFTPEELGLIKLWIDQGARGEIASGSDAIHWQPLPPGFNPIYAVAVSPYGDSVAAGRANQIFIYSAASQQELGRLTDPELLEAGLYQHPGVAHRDLVHSLAFSPSGQWLASGGFGTVKFWHREMGVRRGELPAAQGDIRALSISNDRRRAAVAEAGGRIEIFDVAGGQLQGTIVGLPADVTSVAFSPDGGRLVGGLLDRTVRVWDVAGRQEIGGFETPTAVSAVAVSGSGKQIIAGGSDHRIRVWAMPEADAPAPPQEQPLQPLKELPGHTSEITALTPLPNHPTQFLSASLDGTARHWDTEAGEIRSFNHGAPLGCLAVRADGTRIATGTEAGTVNLWNAQDGQQIAELASESGEQDEIADMQLAIELARLRVRNAQGDLDAAIKRKQEDADNADKAAVDLVRAQLELKQKTEAATEASAAKEAAEKELEELRTQLAEAEAAKENATDETRAEAESTRNDIAQKVKAAEQKVTELGPPAQKAINEKESAAGAVASAEREVERSKEAMALAAAEVPQLQQQLAGRKQEQKEAEGRLAETQQNAASRNTWARELASKKIAADQVVRSLQDQLRAAQTARDAATEAFAQASEAMIAAAAAARNATNDAQKRVKAASDAKTAADQLANEADARNKATATVKEAADGALAAAQEKLQKAEDEATKAVAEVELQNAVRRQQTAAQEAAEASAALQAAGEAKAAAEKAMVDATADTQRMQEVANQARTDAEKVFQEAQNALSQADTAAGGLEARLATATRSQAAANVALAELRRPVRAVAFSPDGAQLAVIDSQGQTRFYSSESGQMLHQLDACDGAVVAAAQVTGDRLLVAAEDRSLQLRASLPTWTLRRKIGAEDSSDQLTGRITALDFSPSGELLATGGGEPSRSGELKLWNVASGELVRTIPEPHSDVVLGVAFSPDGKYLASCGADRFVRVFEVETGQLVKSFEGHTHHVLGVSWRADGRLLATSGADNVIKIWDFDTGEQIRTIEGFNKEITAIEFLGASDNFVISTGSQQVATRNTGGGGGPDFAGGTDFMYDVETSRDGRLVVAAGQDSVLRIWDQQGNSIATFAPPPADDVPPSGDAQPAPNSQAATR